MQNKKTLKLIIEIICFAFFAVLIYFSAMRKPVPTPLQSNFEYKNTTYGFSIALPESWKGYSVTTDKWTGNTFGDQLGEKTYTDGPVISIHNPKWTKEVPYQDIPIMVFTYAQWNDLQSDKFHIGAAPIGPSELASNSEYVFALPARYNYAYPPGYEEVDKIIQSKPIKTFEPEKVESEETTKPDEDLTKLPTDVSQTEWKTFNNGEISFSVPPLNSVDGVYGDLFLRVYFQSKDTENGGLRWNSFPDNQIDRDEMSIDDRFNKYLSNNKIASTSGYKLEYHETPLSCGKRIDFKSTHRYHGWENEQFITEYFSFIGNDKFTYSFWPYEEGITSPNFDKIVASAKLLGCK